MRVLREAVEEALHVFVQERVAADAEAELVELRAVGELAVDQEVRRLEVRRVRRARRAARSGTPR